MFSVLRLTQLSTDNPSRIGVSFTTDVFPAYRFYFSPVRRGARHGIAHTAYPEGIGFGLTGRIGIHSHPRRSNGRPEQGSQT